jgi:hypothetical protein
MAQGIAEEVKRAKTVLGATGASRLDQQLGESAIAPNELAGSNGKLATVPGPAPQAGLTLVGK